MGDWKGSGEERDNKAGGDVNSQIGSFSCFPEPATLDGWLRQRRECIRETRAPPQGWGNGEEGGAGAWLGSVGRELPRAAGKGMAPGNGQLLGKTKGNRTNCLYVSPICNLWAPETAPGGREEGCMSPLGYEESREAFARGVRGGRGKLGKRLWLQILAFFFPPLFSLLCSHPLCHSSHLHFWLHLPSLLFVSSSVVSFLYLPLLSW